MLLGNKGVVTQDCGDMDELRQLVLGLWGRLCKWGLRELRKRLFFGDVKEVYHTDKQQ